ncbi:MAG TPA: M20 family metallopeptidase [Candidatus Limnocylindrales bacterium]|jgi:glutamate carboxypeptidase
MPSTTAAGTTRADGDGRQDVTRLVAVRSAVEGALPRFLGELARLVNIDCGSYTRDGVNEVATWVAAALAELGATVDRRRDPSGRLGDTVVATFERDRSGPRLLLIGHMDTVFDPGTAAARPFRVADGIATGPGVTDMKGGLLAGLHALAALRATAADAADWLPVGRLVFIANPDEEIGSPSSTPHIRAAALESDVALVLECARQNGDIVSARKGIVDLRLTYHGRAAHAGVEPEKGRNALLAAAHQVVALQALNGRWPGVTVNVGVVRGGTRPNVVPESAVVEVDLRSPTRADLEAAEAEVRAIAASSHVPDVTTTIEEMGRHWPMERLPAAEPLIAAAVAIAARLGFELHDASTGGASDANTTAGLGVPSLDGLGPVGGNDHAPGEYLEVASIVPRTTLLALLIESIGASDPPRTGGPSAARR